MKKNKLFLILLALLAFGQTAWADPDLIITSAADWNTFASNVGNGTNSYQGKTVMLAADINVSSMVDGTFKGTLDGCGHTITLSLSAGSTEHIALFKTLENATIKNLIIAGTVTTGKYRPASIASYIGGSGTTTIMNCWSSVAITSNYTASDWVDAGAFVARVSSGATLNMTNCLFTGSVTYHANNYEGGGMVGWTQDNATANLTNCLFAPSSLTMSISHEKTYVFVSGNTRGNLTNCYFNSVANASVLQNEGTYTNATGEALRALLGSGWEVSGGNVVPKMPNSLDYYLAYNTATGAFETLTANNCTQVTSGTTTMGAANTVTWYVVNSAVTVNSSRIEVLGTVNLIHTDGKTFRAEKGLHVPSGVTLNIYGQSSGTGQLKSFATTDGQAGIGGNYNEAGGTLTIHGGSIEAIGCFWGAGIGGGYGGNGGNITIYGGSVNATGSEAAAGIGGGAAANCGTVTIIGGTVIATARTSYEGDNSQAIGSGTNGFGGTLILGDMKVYASANATNPVAYTNRESTCHSKYAKLVPCTDHHYVNNECTYCGALNIIPVTYLAYQTATYSFVEQTVIEPTLVDENTTTMGAAGTETWYAVRRNVSNSNRIEVLGTVHLILCDDKTLTSSKGITVNSGNSLAIYGQAAGTGALNATGSQVGGDGTESAPIGSTGSTSSTTMGSITIHGGHITANSAGWTAGIGGGIRGGGGSITLYGGTINATGHGGASEGIGHGSNGADVTRTLADGLRVTTGNNTTPVACGDRVSALNQLVVRVEPCTEHHITDNHCDYCGITWYNGSYDSNNATSGTVPAETTVYERGETVTVLDNTGNLERTGYIFAGWNTAANGSGTTYAAGATFTIIENTTLYAKWTPITYIVRFHKNHDDATGTMDDQTLTYDIPQTLTANAFIRDGYALVGWSTTSDGPVAYTDGQSVCNLVTEQSAVINLYAQWAVSYTITYDLAGGSVATPNPTIYTAQSEAITLVNPTREHYAFVGWTGTDLTEPTMTVTIPTGSTGDREYTATWIMATITLENNTDNSAIIAQTNGILLESVTLTDRTLYRNGDWNTIVLPFDLNSLNGTPLQRFKLKTLSSTTYSDGTLTMNFADASTIEAGKPYIVKYQDADLVISSAADWNSFANSGNTYQGKIVKLAADITVSTMAGNFKGTFDGGGHKLTFNITYTNGTSLLGPFRFIDGATIKNLFVEGSVTSMGGCFSGLVGRSDGTVTISNCVVSASITCNPSSSFASHCGGFIGEIHSGSVTFNNCAFKGRLLGSNSTTNGGFVGYKDEYNFRVVFNNCLFAPAQVTMSATNSGTYINTANYNDYCITYNNSYYKTKFGEAQETKTTNTGTALQNQLGNGWEVVNGNVVPKMTTTVSDIVNPVFTNVTISNATNNITTTYVDFIGSYAPISNGLLDAHNPNGDAMHAAISISDPSVPAGYSGNFEGWYSDAEKTIAASVIPFDANGNVTLYAKFPPSPTPSHTT